MKSEDLTDNGFLPVNETPQGGKFNLKSLAVPVQLIVFLLGVGLLVFVLNQIGWRAISEALTRVGWGFLIILSLNGARHFLRAWCIYLAVPVSHRSFKYRYALAARLGGEAVSFLTFTGPLLGEATKAALLKNRVPLAQGVTAVVVDNILYDISVLLLVMVGVILMFSVYGDGDRALNYALFGIIAAGLLIILLIFLTARFRVKPLTWLLKKADQRNRLPHFLEKKKTHIFQVEENVYHFYVTRRASFCAVSSLIFLSHLLSVCEVYIALRLLGFAAYLDTSYIIETLTKVINLAFSFVPGTVGVYEGGNGIILRSLGYAAATGVMLALVRRGASLFWILIGVVILLWRMVTRGSRHLNERKSSLNS